MRLMFVALLMVLLPWRAWLGDGMALGVLTPGGQLTPVASAVAGPLEASALPCHDEVAAAAGVTGASLAGKPGDHTECAQCSTCELCQICHGAVLFAALNPIALTAQPPQAAPLGQGLFATLHHAPQLKPPIS